MSRMHHRREGYPFGSLVDFAPDSMGRKWLVYFTSLLSLKSLFWIIKIHNVSFYCLLSRWAFIHRFFSVRCIKATKVCVVPDLCCLRPTFERFWETKTLILSHSDLGTVLDAYDSRGFMGLGFKLSYIYIFLVLYTDFFMDIKRMYIVNLKGKRFFAMLTWVMKIEIHNEIQSITSTDKYELIELNDYVFL